jgi:hypothetical protein
MTKNGSKRKEDHHAKKEADDASFAEAEPSAAAASSPPAASSTRTLRNDDTASIGSHRRDASSIDSQGWLGSVRGDDASHFEVLATEFEDAVALLDDDHSQKTERESQRNRRLISNHQTNQHFWHRMKDIKLPHPNASVTDPYFDLKEKYNAIISGQGKEVEIPSLVECKAQLVNPEYEAAKNRALRLSHKLNDIGYDIVAAFYIYLVNTLGLETILIVTNATLATYFFCARYEEFATRLDFSFLAFAIVFPLTFLIQAVFNRREQALVRLADFKAAVLSTTLFTMTVDWASSDGSLTRGRLSLPKQFNANVLKDSQTLVQLCYEYLSMPNVSHARNIVFPSKQRTTRRVHAAQNEIIKRINDVLFDFSMHTEEMRRCGFPSGEASRLHQYHSFLAQRFEQLRIFKYYRTPQATRSFGLAYILILPWMSGPYFAYVFETTNYAFTLSLAAFTFLVLLGLLNTQKSLEDPFYADYRSWTPGIDTVKLDFEMAVVLQSLEQFYANAELRRRWETGEHKKSVSLQERRQNAGSPLLSDKSRKDHQLRCEV